jgi:hypothetical protein
MTMNTSQKTGFAIFGLLFGATCWGAIWYPYRLLADAGVSGISLDFLMSDKSRRDLLLAIVNML